MSLLVVAANSARLLAELARAEGHEVIALDLFGDLDTRRASRAWHPIGLEGDSGGVGGFGIDTGRTLAALERAAKEGAAGWLAGSGLEGEPALLERGAALLPLIGTAPAEVRRVRDPGVFFACVAALGGAFPETRSTAPPSAEGWLLKNARGSGGWHIRDAATQGDRAPAEGDYWQREAAGLPMSTTFLADGSDALVLGHNQLIVRRYGHRPHVYAGAIGPVPVPAAVARELARLVHGLSREFALRGLCSLDFLLDGERVLVLEVNPRPPASLALHAHRLPPIAAQLQACLGGRLPGALGESQGLRAHRIVYARRALQLDEAGARCLEEAGECHDLPAAGTRFAPGDPVFSLSAEGPTASALADHLRQRRDALLSLLETPR